MSTAKHKSAPKILVVDDEVDAVELVEFNLTAAGFSAAAGLPVRLRMALMRATSSRGLNGLVT